MERIKALRCGESAAVMLSDSRNFLPEGSGRYKGVNSFRAMIDKGWGETFTLTLQTFRTPDEWKEFSLIGEEFSDDYAVWSCYEIEKIPAILDFFALVCDREEAVLRDWAEEVVSKNQRIEVAA